MPAERARTYAAIGMIAIGEGRLAAARVHRFPAQPLPAEVGLTTQAGRTYRLRLEAADSNGLTVTVLDVQG